MNVSDFDFDLPPDLIAQAPAPRRGEGRLLHLSRSSGLVTHTQISALPEPLAFRRSARRQRHPRVSGPPARPSCPERRRRRVPSRRPRLRARVRPRRRPDSEAGDVQIWEALMHPGQKLKPGARVIFEGSVTIHGEVLERRFHGRRLIRLWTDDGAPLDAAVDAIGHVPLPPYIKRPDRAADRERYQTVFARQRGSVAAPTAGLHLSDALLDALRGTRDRDSVHHPARRLRNVPARSRRSGGRSPCGIGTLCGFRRTPPR